MTEKTNNKISRRKLLTATAATATTATAGCISNPFSENDGEKDVWIHQINSDILEKSTVESDARSYRNQTKELNEASEQLDQSPYPTKVRDWDVDPSENTRGVMFTHHAVLGIPDTFTVPREVNGKSISYTEFEKTERLGETLEFEDAIDPIEGDIESENEYRKIWEGLEDLTVFTAEDDEGQPYITKETIETLEEELENISDLRSEYQNIIQGRSDVQSPREIRNSIDNMLDHFGGAELETLTGSLASKYFTEEEREQLEEGEGDYQDFGLKETRGKVRGIEDEVVEGYLTLRAHEAIAGYALEQFKQLDNIYDEPLEDDPAPETPKDEDEWKEYGDLDSCNRERADQFYESNAEGSEYQKTEDGDIRYRDPDRPEEKSGSFRSCIL